MMKFGVAMVMVVALLLVEVGPLAEAVTCNPSDLASCLPAITGGSKPSDDCCSKLTVQKPCLCGYLKDPSLKQYLNSPNAKKAASDCGIAIPTC